MPHPHQVALSIVVSGVPVPIDAKPHEHLEKVVREALRATGHHGVHPTDWELRTADGTPLNLALTVADAGLVDGATLFLSPRAAGGG
jgi:hypothetical protein